MDRFRRKEKVTTTPVAPAKIEGKDAEGKPAPVVGDTPSGYVEKSPAPTSGTTTIRYSKRSGGRSSRKVTLPSGETTIQSAEEAQKGENLPVPQKKLSASTAKQKLSSGQPLTQEEYDAYKKSRNKMDYVTGKKFSLMYAPSWLGRKLFPAHYENIDRGEQQVAEFREKNYPNPQNVAWEIMPEFQSKVDSGEYKIDDKGNLIGQGKAEWDRRFQQEYAQDILDYKKKAKAQGFSENINIPAPKMTSGSLLKGFGTIDWKGSSVPVNQESVIDAAAGAWLFTGFSPAFQTGTATEQDVIIRKGKSGGKIKGMTAKEYSAQLDKALKGDYWTQQGKTAKYVPKTTSKEKADILKSLLSKASSPQEKKLILEASYRALGSKEFGKVISFFPKQTQFNVPKTSTATDVKVDIQTPAGLANMEKIGLTGGLFSTGKLGEGRFDIPNVKFNSAFQGVSDITTPETTTEQKPITIPTLSSKSSSKQKTTTIPIVTPAITPITTTIQPPISRLKPKFPTPFQESPSYRQRFQPTRPLFKIPKFNLGGDFGKLPKGNVGAAPKFSYTPSFTSLIRGTRGKKPSTKRFKGFETRPITSGWLGTLGLKPKKRRRKRR